MERKNMRELLEFAQDEKRLDAAINNVIAGIENGTIDVATLPLAAPPIRPSLMTEPQQAYLADLLVKVSGVELNSEQMQALLAEIRGLPVEGTMKDLEATLADHPLLGELGTALRNSSQAPAHGLYSDPENQA